MRIKLQLIMCNDQNEEETVTDVITLNKNNQRIEHLGLSLAESKQLLSTLQRHLLQQQVTTFLDTCSDCPRLRDAIPGESGSWPLLVIVESEIAVAVHRRDNREGERSV